jgi:hypothetical protein
MSAQTLERAVGNDRRVDQIGYVAELVKQFAEPAKAALKLRMAQREIDLAEGSKFQALLVGGGSIGVVDPARLLKLYEGKQITRQQFLSAITVRNEPCRQFLSRDAIDAISAQKPAEPRLTVSRRKGVEISLVEAVRELAEIGGQ